MYRGQPSKPFTLPSEYRKAADRLFPKDGIFKSLTPDLKASAEFAKTLGIGIEYQRLLSLEKQSGELHKFLSNFQNNLDLLIKKTWVEKSDENRKNNLQDGVPTLMDTIESAAKNGRNFAKAIEDFSTILDELAYLLFGAQSEKEDFTEYTFRIDAQMGLFWWYGSKLYLYKELKDEKIAWAVLLLGLCYLTNF
ncbi:MAG: hypothetical protein FWB86_05520 [Treponema sp.]|nr:hypothetical protein [Treponema sp.]